MVINLRATNGAGKSTAIRALMEKSNVHPIFGTTFGLRCPEGYKARLPQVEADVFVLGPYTAQCGGCDRIQPYDLIPRLIEKYAVQGHLIFEGALISTCWGAIGRPTVTIDVATLKVLSHSNPASTQVVRVTKH